jgi:hypothetical protein
VRHVRILIKVVDPARVQQGRTAFGAVHLVVLGEQQLRQVRAVLPGDPGDERFFHSSLD